jgi:hypothetical protein
MLVPMQEWGDQERRASERILSQTAALFAQHGDDDVVELLRMVHRVEFEQTDDGFRDATGWHEYYWAAIFYVPERDRERFTDTALQRLVPLLAEVTRQNGQSHAIDRVQVRPVLPEVDEDWRTTLGRPPAGEPPHQPPPTSATTADPARSITEVTRRRLSAALRDSSAEWAGDLDEVDFLRRLYDLDRMESYDSRYATAEGDIIQHRLNNEDWDADWVFSDSRFGLADGPDEVLLRFLAEMLHPAVRMNTEETQHLLDLFNDMLARDGYELAPADAISGYPVYGPRRITVRASPSPASAPHARAVAAGTTDTASGYGAVRRLARGDRGDYACDRLPIADSGQADVFRATHKPTGTTVALKKLHLKRPRDHQIARMRREIEVGRHLDSDDHAMPILDYSPDHTWFVMPWAEATAESRQENLQSPDGLRILVDALADVLSAAHTGDWIHRDIKPSNILLLDGRWRLADWGAVRRPHGQTTKIGRTAAAIGTEGFAAPELTDDAHQATAASDIYSIGRVIAWALTGKTPKANLPLLPEPGPWRPVVQKATRTDPRQRPQTISEMLVLIDRVHGEWNPPQDPLQHAAGLAGAAEAGDQNAVAALLTLAADHEQDYELYLDALIALQPQKAASALSRDLPQAHSIIRALAVHVDGPGTRWVQFSEAARAVIWLHGIAAHAAAHRHWDLLEEAAQAMCTWDAAWDQWSAQNRVGPWLRTLKGDAAAVMAAVLRDHPDSAAHFSSLAQDRTADDRLRHAVTRSEVPSRFPEPPEDMDMSEAMG